jgi:hypothetical protein
MPTDAIVLEHDHAVVLDNTTPTNSIIRLAPLPNGKSYVILAKGSIFTRNATATLRLDAEGVTDSIEASFEEREGETSFVLAVALTLPPDDEFYSVVELSGTARIVSPSATVDHSFLGMLKNAKLVALAVDSLAVQLV